MSPSLSIPLPPCRSQQGIVAALGVKPGKGEGPVWGRVSMADPRPLRAEVLLTAAPTRRRRGSSVLESELLGRVTWLTGGRGEPGREGEVKDVGREQFRARCTAEVWIPHCALPGVLCGPGVSGSSEHPHESQCSVFPPERGSPEGKLLGRGAPGWRPGFMGYLLCFRKLALQWLRRTNRYLSPY